MIDTIVSLLEVVDLTPLDGIMAVVGTCVLFVFYRILAGGVFGPILEHIEKREELTTGSLHAATEMKNTTAQLKNQYEEELFSARVEVQRERSLTVSAAKEKASKILKAAEDEVVATVTSGRAAIQQQIENAQASSEQEVQGLAEALVSSVDARLSA